MKQCPRCSRKYSDDTFRYCLDDGSVLLTPAEIAGADTLISGFDDTLRWEGDDAPQEIKPPVSLLFSYKKLEITSDLHKYALNVSLTLNQPPAKNGFLLKLGWPKCIRVTNQQGLLETPGNNRGRLEYLEFTLQSKETLWPGQTFEVTGKDGRVEFEYEFDHQIWHTVDGNSVTLNWAIFFLDSMPIEGSVDVDNLNCF